MEASLETIVKLKFDGSLKASSSSFALGFIFRDKLGVPLITSTYHLCFADVLVIEGYTMNVKEPLILQRSNMLYNQNYGNRGKPHWRWSHVFILKI